MRTLLLLTSLSALAACSPELVPAGPAPESGAAAEVEAGRVIDREFIIGHPVSQAELDALGLIEVDWNPVLGAGLYLAAQPLDEDELYRSFARNGKGLQTFVEANRTVVAHAPKDPYWTYQWNFREMGVESAWNYASGAGVTVAVLDTGVSAAGEDTPVHLVQGWDFADGDRDSTDTDGHGTHVAGTIAQATGNKRGAAGIAPDVTLLAVRVLGPYGGSSYDVASGITYAVDQGADVINLSLGSPYASAVERRAVDYAVRNGVVVVAASGNDGKGSVDYPAAFPGVIAVGATGAKKRLASYSNSGDDLDLVAPGGDLSIDLTRDGYKDGILQETVSGSYATYEMFEGTSMAAPHVAGTAALLVELGRDAEEIEEILLSTTKEMGRSGWDRDSGWGQLDTSAAVREAWARLEDETAGDDDDPVDDGGADDDKGDDNQADDNQGDDAPADTTAPTISGVSGDRDWDELTLRWTTSEPATTALEFEDYGVFEGDAGLRTSHEMSFTIDAYVEYTFRFVAEDAAGNESRSGWWVSR